MGNHSTAPLTILQETDSVVTFPPLGPAVNVLMIWPRFQKSYWGMEGMMDVVPERAHMPPLALATIAALLPQSWNVRLIDCAFDELRDPDILGADLVMVSAMYAQRGELREILSRCRRLGRRTIVGGPYASSMPEELLPLADHVVVGEVDESLGSIAADFEAGRARRLYQIAEKPNVTRTPVPRFEIFNLEKYMTMSIQFSRGCPFQCEFCDIITIYGRRPRTKAPAQVIAELEALYRLGWRKWVFIVDDNFIGNHRAALELARELAKWQQSKDYPFAFSTEASIDLAERSELQKTMVEANFVGIFIGIETPSPESLRETKKLQNLRRDPLEQVHLIQQRGLWVTAGFIIGFDSDDETIFDRQRKFIESAAIPWALLNILQAPATTPLHNRMQKQGRLIEGDVSLSGAGSMANFRTVLAPSILFRGAARLLSDLYGPEAFFLRTVSSLERWVPIPVQRVPRLPILATLRLLVKSFWVQGVRSNYRTAYWSFLTLLVRRWWRDPARAGIAALAMISAHHFCGFASELARQLEQEAEANAGIPGYQPRPLAASSGFAD
ncbi:MAG: B12-binding domain-containing radical SAM protein [Terriglobia bacterium]|nr:MAG: B12-binding domain-containing radical SAM protein [Terriglobia bacterium]